MLLSDNLYKFYKFMDQELYGFIPQGFEVNKCLKVVYYMFVTVRIYKTFAGWCPVHIFKPGVKDFCHQAFSTGDIQC